MGWCQDFSVEIAAGCTHPMRPGISYCSCDECGVVCQGKFDGCPEVWLQLSAPRQDAGRSRHPALPRRPTGGERRRSSRLAEPLEVPVSSPPPVPTLPPPAWADPAPPLPGVVEPADAPAAARRTDVEPPTPAAPTEQPKESEESERSEQSVKEWLAGMVATAFRAALAEQAAATDLRFAQLNDVVIQIEAHAATDAMQLRERLRKLLAQHDQVVEARLATYQSELDRLSTVISELSQDREGEDPQPADEPLGAATVRFEEKVAALSEENEELRARLATQGSLVDDLQRSVSDLVADQGRHDHSVLGSSVAAVLDAEVSDLRREVGRLRSQTRGGSEAFRRSIEERIVAVENQSEELEARITARVEGGLTSKFAAARDTNRQHEELRREMARRHAELEDRLVAQRRTLVAIQGALAKLALQKDVRAAVVAPTPVVAPTDEDQGGRRSDTQRPGQARQSARRTEVSALLGAHWNEKADEPAGDRGDRAPAPEEPTEEPAPAKP